MLIHPIFLVKTLEVISISLLIMGVFVYVWFHYKRNSVSNIKRKTIHMQKPFVFGGNTIKREPLVKNELTENLVSKEGFLRKLAYKNTSIKTDGFFFDDSDMKTNYYLIIIYDKKLNTPLLTARYYFYKSLILKYLKGDDANFNTDNSEVNPSASDNILNLNKFKEGELFLIDRLSGNNNCSICRKNRNYVHLLFYLELLTYNKHCKFIVMARKEKFEKLLAKYLRLGLRVVGTAMHMGKEHWVLLGDMKKNYSQLKRNTLLNMILMSKNFISKLKR